MLKPKVPKPTPAATIQARRLAASFSLGPSLLTFLESPRIRAKLIKAAEEHIQPLGAVSEDLAKRFPTEILDPVVRRKIGFFISAIMDREGFCVDRPNVRMKNARFSSGATYRKRSEEAPQPGDLISRLAASLNEDEAVKLARHLVERFPSVKSAFR